MLSAFDLSFHYRKDFEVLQKIAFQVEKGKRLAVLGNNGAGKSTLLKCLNRIVSPHGGSVLIDGENVLKMTHKRIAQNLSFVSQTGGLSRMTVYDTIMLGRKPYIQWALKQEDETIVRALITRLHLEDMALRFVDELSGGEQQKVLLARALAQNPKALLLDEPTSSLDLRNQYEVLGLIKKLCDEQNIAVIMVLHDINLALRFCDTFMLIKDKRVFAAGGREIITGENIEAVYQIPVVIKDVDNVRLVIPLIL